MPCIQSEKSSSKQMTKITRLHPPLIRHAVVQLCLLSVACFSWLVSPSTALAQSNAAAVGDGIINTFAGVPTGGTPANGDNVPPNTYPLYAPTAVATDAAGNVYIANADTSLPVVLVVYLADPMPPLLAFRANNPPSPFAPVTPTKGDIYIVAGTQTQSTVPCGTNGTGDLCGDGASALSATLNVPQDIAVDSAGNLYIADSGSNAIRKVTASSGVISTIVGDPMHVTAGYGGENVPALGSFLSFPTAVVFDTVGDLYIADGNAIIRKVSKATNKISTVVGTIPNGSGAVTCMAGPCGDGGLATQAQLGYAPDLSIDAAGDLYISDENAAAIRRVDATTQIINTVAGTMPPAGSQDPFPDTCTAAPCGDGGAATSALLNGPFYAQLDSKGNLLIADTADGSLRYVDTLGVIHTAVGKTTNPGYTGDTGKAIDAELNGPQGFAFDAVGNLYIADTTNSVVRSVSAPRSLTPQSITFAALATEVYGASPLTLDATASSGLEVSYAVTGPATIAESTLTITGAGNVTVTASQSGNGTYAAATPVSQSFTVSPAVLTVTAKNVSREVGQPNPALTYIITGFVGSDTSSVVSGSVTLATTAVTSSPTGQYPITFVGSTDTLAAASYIFTFVNGNLTVAGTTPQTITFSALPTVTYGSANSTVMLAATASSGLPVIYAVTGPARLQGANLTVTGAGTVTVTAQQAGNGIYAPAVNVTQTLTVKPAVLTITASNATLQFGQPAPTFTYTANGFVSTDTSAVLSGAPAFSTTATATSAPGNYPITLTQGTLFAQNYTFVFVPGVLTITQTAQTITFPTIPALTGNLGNTYTLQATASSGLPVQYTSTGSVSILTGGILYVNGPGPATVTASQPGNADYAAATPITQSFSTGLIPLVVTALSYSRPFGAANPVLSYGFGAGGNSVSIVPGTVTGLPSLTTVANADSPTGTYPIVITQGTLASSLYTFTFANGTLTVTPPSTYTLTVDPGSVTVPIGQSRQVTVTLTQINNYVGTVTLGCSGLPAGVTCVASPSSLSTTSTVNGSGLVQGTLTISAGQTVAARGAVSPGTFLAQFLWIPAGCTGCWMFIRRRRLKKDSPLYFAAILIVLLFTMAGLTACGGGNSASSTSVQAGTTQVMVIANGTGGAGTGDVAQSIALTVIIQ